MATQFRHKHQAFIDSYTTPKTPGYLNAAESARISGFSNRTPTNASKIGNLLLKKPEIRTRIDSILEEQKQRRLAVSEITRDELTVMVHSSLEEVPATHANKPRYFEILAKLRGFLSDAIQNNILFYQPADENVRASVDQRIEALARRMHRDAKAK